MDLERLTAKEIKQGFSQQAGQWRCLCCGQIFADGEIYPVDGRFFLPERAVKLHMQQVHGNYREELIDSESKYNPLTDNQRQLMHQFAKGLADKEVAGAMGVTPSTVRHQRFQFREKAKQARMYLAIYESTLQNEAKEHAMMPIHEHAKMVDERYVVTEEERAHILQTSFLSIEPLRLRQFSPKEKKKLVVLARIAAEFQPGHSYSEREINAVLKPIFADFATLRRYLIEYGFMQRNPDGSQYRLTEKA